MLPAPVVNVRLLDTLPLVGHELVGGQALVEGVMIRRGPTWSAAARRSDGTIATTIRTVEPALAPIRSIPLLRGSGALVDSISIGAAAMRWSRHESGTTSGTGTGTGTGDVGGSARERVVVAAVVVAVLAAFLFIPLAVAAAATPVVGRGLGAAAVEGLVRLALFVGYLAGLSRLPGIQRVLEYHGAEHMVIAAYEHGEPPTVASARDHSPRHPRCGTDFFLLIFVISILALALVGHLPVAWLVASRVLLVPVVVGIAYEVLRFGGTSSHGRIAGWFAAPGLMLQRFTTREPEDGQIEVALAALAVLTGDGRQVDPATAGQSKRV